MRHHETARDYFDANDRSYTAEWERLALASAVVLVAITMIWAVLNLVPTSASTVATKITSCQSYAAQHQGSTAGC